MDPLFASGAGKARGDFVVLRCVTLIDSQDAEGLVNGILQKVSDKADVRKAQLFEIVDVGAKVPKDILTPEDVGNFCVSLATSLNPVNGMKESLYALVRADTISAVIDADQLVLQANAMVAHKAKAEAEAKAKAAVHFS